MLEFHHIKSSEGKWILKNSRGCRVRSLPGILLMFCAVAGVGSFHVLSPSPENRLTKLRGHFRGAGHS